jgi:hypothetical protein
MNLLTRWQKPDLNVQLCELSWHVATTAIKRLGNYQLTGYLFRMEPVNSPSCKRCQNKNKTASHILCNYEVLDSLQFHITWDYTL